MCPTRQCCTSEDECKWFYCHMIYSPETKQKQDGEILNMVSWNIITIYIQMVLFTVITYSVHDGSFLSRRTLPPVFLVAPWECCPLLCCWSTAYLAPCLEGRALPHSPSRVNPISLRVQAPSCFFVGYNTACYQPARWYPPNIYGNVIMQPDET